MLLHLHYSTFQNSKVKPLTQTDVKWHKHGKFISKITTSFVLQSLQRWVDQTDPQFVKQIISRKVELKLWLVKNPTASISVATKSVLTMNWQAFLDFYWNFILPYLNSSLLLIDGSQMPPEGVSHTREVVVCLMNLTKAQLRICSA